MGPVGPVVVPVRPLPMVTMPGGRLILRLPLSRRLDLFARWCSGHWRSIRRTPAVMMRPVPAAALAARTAVIAPFALALGPVKPGLRSAETPDLFEFRLGALGRGTFCGLWRCGVWRQRSGLC